MTQSTMTKTSAERVQQLRELTGAGIMDCKRALAEADGDFEVAKDLLRKKGLAIAKKKASRQTTQGQVFSYVHLGGKIGVLVEINCETDFVARTEAFREFGRDVAMQIAATRPLFVSREEADPAWLEREKEVFCAQAADKPRNVQEKVIHGKLQKRLEEVCLLDQKFIKDENKTIQDLVTELTAKLGERVVIKCFRRFEVGSE